jgi:cobalt/nickel transport system ATP-binding protein
MTAAIEIDNLSATYPDGTQVLHDVTFQIEPGERVALLGPNGAGKTSLALHLNGILGTSRGSSRTGRIAINGLVVTTKTVHEIRRRVGVVFQDPDDQLFTPRVRDDVAFGPANLGLRGDELDKRVREALLDVDMLESIDRPPHHLSYGQKRRVAVATVLAMHPDVLVLDEPSTNLDPTSRRELADVLRRLDLTMLMITHDLPYALELCDRAIILDSGRVVADGSITEILSDSELLRRHRLELPYGFSPPSSPPLPLPAG